MSNHQNPNDDFFKDLERWHKQSDLINEAIDIIARQKEKITELERKLQAENPPPQIPILAYYCVAN